MATRVGGASPRSLVGNEVTEPVCQLQGNVETYALTRLGTGYKVEFFISISQAEEILKLNSVLKRVVLVEVHKIKSKREIARDGDGSEDDSEDDDAWLGVDDE